MRYGADELVALLGGPPDRTAPGRLGARFAARLREVIRTGLLPPGTLVPPSRAVAEALDVSRGVVVSAYDQLLSEGFLVARQGSGTRVADLAGDPAPPLPPAAAPPAARPGVPDLREFPRTRWLAAYRHATSTMSTADLGYGDPRGHVRLRTELAGQLRRTRSAVVDPDLLVVVAGVADGLTLLADAMPPRRRRVAVEDPTSPGTRMLLSACGLDVVGVPVDGEGIVVEAIRDPERLAGVLVTPAHQYPTGVVLSAARRRALVDLAREHAVLLIEDDYDGSFRYHREPVGCLQGLAPDVTALLGSVSKTLAPGLRLGWLVAPQPWQRSVVQRRTVTNQTGQTLDQLAFAQLLANGGYDHHVRRMRRTYQDRRRRLTAELAAVPGVRTHGDASGLHLLVELPAGADEQAVLSRLRECDFDVQGLGQCRIAAEPDAPGGVIVGFAALPAAALTRLVTVLRAALPAPADGVVAARAGSHAVREP